MEMDGFLSGGRLDRMGDLATRFSTVFDDHRRESSKRTCAVFEFLDHGLFSVCDEEFWEMGHITSEGFWDDPSVREGKEFEEDRHHSGHRGEAKWNHEDAALGEKLPDEINTEKMSHGEDGVEEFVHGYWLEIEVKDQFKRFVRKILFQSGRHRGDRGITDGIQSEAFLDFARFHVSDELNRAHLAAGLDEESNG